MCPKQTGRHCHPVVQIIAFVIRLQLTSTKEIPEKFISIRTQVRCSVRTSRSFQDIRFSVLLLLLTKVPEKRYGARKKKKKTITF